MAIFNHILIPISSEFYSKKVIKRAVFLYGKFQCNITVLFIIEKKTLLQTNKLSDSYMTSFSKTETNHDIVTKSRLKGDKVVLDNVKNTFRNKGIIYNEKVVEEEYSIAVNNELKEKTYDLVLMSFQKDTVLNYRLIDKLNFPLWIESVSDSKSILAVCSNLAPNKKVPALSIKLAKIFGWELHMLYVVDPEDAVFVDDNGVRSGSMSEEDLLESGKLFAQNMRKNGVNVILVRGSLEKETVKAAEKINANLVIVGREQKRKKVLGLPAKNVKKKLTEKCRYSILFVN